MSCDFPAKLGFTKLMFSMNGEVRIWDARKSDVPLYEEIVQPHGLMALAVHSGAPVIAR